MAIMIDALGLAEDFEKAGFSRDQALEAGIGQKLATTGLIRWFTGIMIAQGAAIVALIKLLPGPS